MLAQRLPTEKYNNAYDEQQTNVLSCFDWAIRVQWTRKNNEYSKVFAEWLNFENEIKNFAS